MRRRGYGEVGPGSDAMRTAALDAGVTLVGVVLAIFVDRAEKSRLARTPARVAVNA